MWQPFRRRGDLDRSESSGIGLAIVRTLANHLGGLVSVESQVGAGTKFQVSIPMPECREDEPAAEPSAKLLIVDDRPDVLEGLAWATQHLGYPTDTADCAAVAANLMAANDYDLVLVDLEMPIKSGKQLASEIRRGRGRNRDTTMIAISASSEARGIGEAWPFDGFQEKGRLDRRGLQRLIESCVATPRAPSTIPPTLTRAVVGGWAASDQPLAATF